MISLKVTSTIQKTEKWSIEKWEKGKRKGTYFKRKEKEKFEKEDKEQDKGDDKNKMLNNQQEDKKEEERPKEEMEMRRMIETQIETMFPFIKKRQYGWSGKHLHRQV